MGALHMYRIEVDGHLHGGPVPRPWVARIDGPDPVRYGLRREFIRPLNDWAEAHVAWSGNTYGVVATFPLRRGHLYEVSRLRGKPSKRHLAREFWWLPEEGRMCQFTAEEVLAHVDGDADGSALYLNLREPAPDEAPSSIAEVSGLGMPRSLGWVVVGDERRYRLLAERVYEIAEFGQHRLVMVRDGGVVGLTEEDAWRWIRRSAS